MIMKLFLVFMFYSVMGWVIEVIRVSIFEKKFVNRGFLIGPYLPIYGVGVILITLVLENSSEDIPTIFLKSIFICSILEYFTSYLLEKIYKYRWWDYSKRKFNINGRICLETMVPFGLAACIIIKIINPLVFCFINSLNESLIIIFFIILLTILVLDFSVTIILLNRIKGVEKNIKADSTSKIKEEFKNSIFYRRIFISFPNLKILRK